MLLTGCKSSESTNKLSEGVYLTSSAYYGWVVGSIWLNSIEHFYSVSDSLIVHSLVSSKGIREKEYIIDKVVSRGKDKDVYFALNVNAAFVLNRRNKSIGVFKYNKKKYALEPIPSEVHFGLVLVENYDSSGEMSFDQLISRGH